jgi:signal transduction histidine kinase
MLYAVQMRIHLIEMDLSPAQTHLLQTHIDEIARLTNEAIQATRTLSVELSPPILENEGLPEAIYWLSQQMQEIYSLRISLTAEGDCQVENRNLRILLFQIGRELLFNVVKHGGVEEATVLLKRIDEQILIQVNDRGKGMDLDAFSLKSVGFGLASIRERLDLFNGQLHIESALGQGTQITVTCPL